MSGIFNLFGDEWEGGRDRPGWQWRYTSVAERLGAQRIGAGLYEIAPGQKTFPYHWHLVEEEWLKQLYGAPYRDYCRETSRFLDVQGLLALLDRKKPSRQAG